MTWKESNHFLCWYSYQQFDFLAVTFLQVNFAELTVSKLFYNPQHNSNLSKIRNKHKEYNFACKKKSKYCYNILQQETAWHQGARKHQWRGARGRNIVPIMLQTSTNTKSVFCKNLDNWLTFAYWVLPFFFSEATITWRMWWFDLSMMMMSLTNDDDDDKDDIKTIKTIILSLQVTSIISAFSSN